MQLAPWNDDKLGPLQYSEQMVGECGGTRMSDCGYDGEPITLTKEGAHFG